MSTEFVERLSRHARNGGAVPADRFSSMRIEALDRFAQLGVPTQQNEDWHFTGLQKLAAAELVPAALTGESTLTHRDIEDLDPGRNSWPTLVFVNGRYNARLSTIENLPEGVRALPLSSVLGATNDPAAAMIGTVASFAEHSFTALIPAFMQNGALVHASAGIEAAVPIRLLYITDSNAAGTVIQPRAMIVADANSRLTVIESFVGLNDAVYMTNAVTEVVVAQGATVNHYKLQRESRQAFHVGTSEARQARDSHYVSFSFATGARLSRTNIYTVLDGEGSGATLNGLYMVDGDQHVDHQTRIEHAQPNCFSREVYKGILDGESHGVFNGKVYVHPIAQKTDGKQSNNNLLLSERAHIDTKPQLEIFADDVKCTHGATVGRLDDVALFYMKSRGLDADTARELLTYAFAAEVLEQIELEELKLELESMTMSRFTRG